jgi:hypothetical protein
MITAAPPKLSPAQEVAVRRFFFLHRLAALCADAYSRSEHDRRERRTIAMLLQADPVAYGSKGLP